MQGFDDRDVASFMWGMERLKAPIEPRLLEQLMRRVQAVLPTARGNTFTTILWSLSAMQLPLEEHLVNQIKAYVRHNHHSFHPQQAGCRPAGSGAARSTDGLHCRLPGVGVSMQSARTGCSSTASGQSVHCQTTWTLRPARCRRCRPVAAVWVTSRPNAQPGGVRR